MLQCDDPVILKSGLAVPCGKCLSCRAARRQEWSIRLAIHVKYADRMPLFLTLTYDNEHLPKDGKLHREHVSAFLKEYKRYYGLSNDVFTYFGCGEHGDLFGRQHFHLLFFGDAGLYAAFDADAAKASERVQKIWKNGFVHVCVAGFDGIHYVTKYVLKDPLDLEDDPDLCKESFTICSKNLGAAYFKSLDCMKLRSKLYVMMRQRDEIYRNMPDYDFYNRTSIKEALEYLDRYVPKFTVILDDDRVVYLPRYFRKRLLGEFECFKDNPLWLYNHLRQLLQSFKYYDDFLEYDKTHEVNMASEKLFNYNERVKRRLLERKYASKFKKL